MRHRRIAMTMAPVLLSRKECGACHRDVERGLREWIKRREEKRRAAKCN
jgi:hypothetical protein